MSSRTPVRSLVIIALLLLTAGTSVPAQPVLLSPPDNRHVRIVTRWNMRRYEDGRYLGLTFREIDATLRTDGADSPATGQAIVFEQTLRDMRDAARAVRSSAPGNIPTADDLFRPVSPSTLPLRAGVPAFQDESVNIGDRWQAPGIAWVDPTWNGAGLLVPFTASYRYEGRELYQGRQAYRISGEYGLRWPPHLEDEIELPPSDVVALQSSHRLIIMIDAETGVPILLRDTIREDYRMVDGRTITFDGFSLTWYRTIAPGADQLHSETLEQSLKESPIDGVTVDLTDLGARIRIDNLRFVADSAQLLPEEEARMVQVGANLLRLPEQTRFLVVGHTADAGTVAGQHRLSIERAQEIVTALVNRGVEARRFLFEGRGATEPIADNRTEAGMAANRRVEIYVLSD